MSSFFLTLSFIRYHAPGGIIFHGIKWLQLGLGIVLGEVNAHILVM